MTRAWMPWTQVLRKSWTQVDALADFLQLKDEQRTELLQRGDFPLLVPQRLADKMRKGTLDDPLLRQFVPLQAEAVDSIGFKSDPVEDRRFQKTPRLLHKYEGRVLLVTTGACAMHCRYCFRQNYDYEQSADFAEELGIIRSDESIKEVILSGGDPLSLSNRRLGDLLHALSAIPHVKRIRFHSRFVIGVPERIDASFLELLRDCRPQIFFVVHCNHPAELDDDLVHAFQLIQREGIPVLNQAVLLRGVNDSVETLFELCERLVDCGVLPYYLHQLDRVQGAQHFEVPVDEGLKLTKELSQRISGYAVPKYVAEIAGDLRKRPL